MKFELIANLLTSIVGKTLPNHILNNVNGKDQSLTRINFNAFNMKLG